MFSKFVRRIAQITDRLEHFWHHRIMDRTAGTFLVLLYLFMIVLVEFQRQGWLPPLPFGLEMPETHFFAVEVAFNVLLLTEVVDLTFGLTRSFSRSIGIQLEILSLILLRDIFKKFTEFPEPLTWGPVSEAIISMSGEAGGALLMFVIIGIYYRLQKSRAITQDEVEQQTFIATKKVIALGLLATLGLIAVIDISQVIRGVAPIPFFFSFYTVLIFTDVLMVLISLRFSTLYAVTFRNFGYAAVTVFIRLALIAPAPLNAAIGVGTAIFAVAVAVAYNYFGGELVQQSQEKDVGAESETQEVPQSESGLVSDAGD